MSKSIITPDHTINILNNINFRLGAGTSVSIQGRSGSGKTTLWHLLAGLDTPNSGKIYFENQELFSYSEEERADLRARNMGFIFQQFCLIPYFTALDNVMLPLHLHAVPALEMQERALFWLDKVGLSHRIHHKPAELSGGEQQRVAIARAFISRPKIIFADEMTGNLDYATGEQMIKLIFDLNRSENTTLFIITHDEKLSEACSLRYSLQEGSLFPL